MSKQLNDHTQRSHALLSASGASRWLNCTPSAVLEEKSGKKATSVFAEEGTIAHELSEVFIKQSLGLITQDEYDGMIEELAAKELFSDEMFDVVPTYSDYCVDQYREAKEQNGSAIIEIEQKLDLTEYVPESFGTADCVVISDHIMEVIDLKYGKGVPVYATYNKQLMLYGLGAYLKYSVMYDITDLRLTIIQPRINNISSFDISVDELLKWADNDLKPAAQMAFAGEGELKSGDWCRFCSVKHMCRQLYNEAIELAKQDFKEPYLLSDDEIVNIIKLAPKISDYTNAVTEYAQTEAIEHGKKWPGYKLVDGRSVRKWLGTKQAEDAIKANLPELSEDQYMDYKLKPLTAIEKLVGKKRFSAAMSGVVIKATGKPTLVPLEDKRPERGVDSARVDFE